MDRLIGGFCRILEWTIVALLALMVVLVFGNVVLRYAFNSGITISEEMSRWLFVWMTFLGAIVALHERKHLGTDMLLSRLKPFGQRACLALAQALMLYCTWLLFSGSLDQVKINLDVEAPVSGASMGIFYASGMVFAVCTGVILAWQLFLTVSGRLRDEDLVQVTESEDLAQVEDLHLDASGTYKSK